MHTIFFSLRRADLCSIAFQRGVLAPFGLTPARYGMLFVLRRGQFRWMRQSDLRRELGVTAATVCKMLRALEELGLVVRSRCTHDRRTNDVSLTEMAIRLLRVIHQRVIAPEWVRIVLHATLTKNGALEHGSGTLKYFLDIFRRGFRDRAQFYFPWCGSDVSD